MALDDQTDSLRNIDLLGVGLGPFHLSLAALIPESRRTQVRFLDTKPEFSWHPELLFEDAYMQTSFLKDLVSPVDPTNPNSFLNYLVQTGRFYQFTCMARKTITRIEFESYLKWVSDRLEDSLQFNTKVENIDWRDGLFWIETSRGLMSAQNLSLGSGPTPKVPEGAKSALGDVVFHVKEPGRLANLNVENKRVLIVGGGQTGLELFRNILQEKFGRPQGLDLITARENFRPLDEAPFTNEYFSPKYVQFFYQLERKTKNSLIESQLFASDGNTPDYLESLFEELYLEREYFKQRAPHRLMPHCNLVTVAKKSSGPLAVHIENLSTQEKKEARYDLILLATGFETKKPPYLAGIGDHLILGPNEELLIKEDYQVATRLPESNKIFAVNYSRKHHGIADPQTSLMAWRSAQIIHSWMGHEIYRLHTQPQTLTWEL